MIFGLLALSHSNGWASAESLLDEQSPPELVLQTGHSKAVEAVVFSPDGQWLASGSFDNTVRIWDVETGRELRSLTGHSGVVRSLACSPDGSMLASGSNDKTLRLWNVASGLEVKRFDAGDSTVEAISFSPDGRTIALAGSSGVVMLLDPATGQEIGRLAGHTAGVAAVIFSTDGKLVASGSSDRTVRLWDVARKKLIRTLTGEIGSIDLLCFSVQNDVLAGASKEKAIQLWSVSNGRKLGFSNTAGVLLSVSFLSADTLTTADASGEISTWQLRPKLMPGINKKVDLGAGEAEAVAATRDGKLLAVGNGSGSISLVDSGTTQILRVLDTHTVGYYGATFSNDRQWLASAGFDNAVKLWDLRNGRNVPSLRGHTGRVTAVVFHPDDQRVISASVDHTIRVWNAVSGRLEKTLTGHSDSISCLAISKTGKFLVSGGADRMIGIWDLGENAPPRFLKGHSGEVVSIDISPDENTIVSGSTDGTIRLWDAASGQTVRTIDGKVGEIDAVAFSRDGKLIASGGIDRQLRLWSAEDGRLAAAMPGHEGKIYSVSFSPDGTRILTSSQDKTVRIWSTSAHDLVRTISGHAGPVYQASYSSDGEFVCSASDDGSVILWKASGKDKAATLVSLKGSDDWLVATPEGFFDGSTASWDQMSWRFEKNTFNSKPVEVFFSEFYAPGLLADILNGRSLPSNSNISKKERQQPRVKISLDRSSADTRSATVSVSISKAQAGAKDVRLFRNGALVKIWRGDVLKGQSSADLTATIPLVFGENRLSAYAFNRDDVKSSDARLTVLGPERDKTKGIAYFFTVGINKYTNAEFDLKYAAPDADDFLLEMKRQQERLKSFSEIKTISLRDSEASRENILRALTDLAARIQPEDVLVIYFAGHGTAQQKRFYLIPHDLGYEGDRTHLDNAGLQTILAHSISDLDLERAIEGLDADRIVMVIDACNSGQAIEAEDKRLGPMNSKGLAQLAYEKGMYILTAAQSYQAANEAARLGHGFLTYALVEEGLKTNAADNDPKDGEVVLREWLDFATRRVPEIQEDDIKTRQLEREKSKAPGNASDIQRPRVFYRRELEKEPLVVARP
jgi:WD40 repeat protein